MQFFLKCAFFSMIFILYYSYCRKMRTQRVTLEPFDNECFCRICNLERKVAFLEMKVTYLMDTLRCQLSCDEPEVSDTSQNQPSDDFVIENLFN